MKRILQHIVKNYNIHLGLLIAPRVSAKGLPYRVLFVHLCHAKGYSYSRIAHILQTSKSTAHRYGKYYTYQIQNNEIKIIK